MLVAAEDKEETGKILDIVREEERRNDALRQHTKAPPLVLAEVLDANATSTEQSFNREQVQEQEQVRYMFSLYFYCTILMLTLS